jgi:hypothetical protein
MILRASPHTTWYSPYHSIKEEMLGMKPHTRRNDVLDTSHRKKWYSRDLKLEEILVLRPHTGRNGILKIFYKLGFGVFDTLRVQGTRSYLQTPGQICGNVVISDRWKKRILGVLESAYKSLISP